jgi:hypothetical protein
MASISAFRNRSISSMKPDQQHQSRDRGDLIISGEARREHGEREGSHVRGHQEIGAGKLVERSRKTKMAISGYARAPASTLARGR